MNNSQTQTARDGCVPVSVCTWKGNQKSSVKTSLKGFSGGRENMSCLVHTLSFLALFQKF